MKVRVVYNKLTEKYRLAYKISWRHRWKWAKRTVFTSSVSAVSGDRYMENFQEIAEFDAIGEAEEFVVKWIAPRDEWYDPRSDEWSVEAEVEIPGVKQYTTPQIEAGDES